MRGVGSTICPVEIASEMSAFRAARVGDHAKHDQLSEGRSGAGDESTGLVRRVFISDWAQLCSVPERV